MIYLTISLVLYHIKNPYKNPWFIGLICGDPNISPWYPWSSGWSRPAAPGLHQSLAPAADGGDSTSRLSGGLPWRRFIGEKTVIWLARCHIYRVTTHQKPWFPAIKEGCVLFFFVATHVVCPKNQVHSTKMLDSNPSKSLGVQPARAISFSRRMSAINEECGF